MLSNITSYLFGGPAGTASPERENVNFHEVEDDDWMIIDKLAEMRKSSVEEDDLIVSSETFISIAPSFQEKQHGRPPVPDNKGSRRRSISCKRLVNRRCSTPLRELSPACINTRAVVPYLAKKESRSSSKSSACDMEESWYVTPPSCFTSGPYETKPSSLENLLIEQPGVLYVNQRKQVQVQKQPQPRPRPQEQPNNEEPRLAKEEMQKLKMTPENATIMAVRYAAYPYESLKTRIQFYDNCARPQDHRQRLLDMHEQKKFINSCQSQISAGQKVEQKQPGQVSKRNQMERMNKVQHELSSRKKRQRRADLTNKKHSGVNNNRKCCY